MACGDCKKNIKNNGGYDRNTKWRRFGEDKKTSPKKARSINNNSQY